MVDGDTLELDGKRIRLHGIDAFELDQPCLDASGERWACGRAAREALINRAAGGHVTCTEVDQDRYGRIVARCVLEDGTDLGDWLVKQGLALDYERYSGGDYADEEQAARAASAGAWQGEFMAPWEWRRHNPQHPRGYATTPSWAEGFWTMETSAMSQSEGRAKMAGAYQRELPRNRGAEG